VAEESVLVQSVFLTGLVTTEEFERRTDYTQVEGIVIPQARLGKDRIEFTVVNQWRGAGRHTYVVEVQEEYAQDGSIGFRWTRTNELATDLDYWALAGVSLPSRGYGALVVNSYCDGLLVQSRRFQVIPSE
jgi:hypothetical protein